MLNRENNLPQQEDDNNEERFISDTQKVVQQHLEDENHVISEEDIRNVRIGMTPPIPDGATEIRDRDEKVADRKADSEDDITPGSQKTTPWDVINPGT